MRTSLALFAVLLSTATSCAPPAAEAPPATPGAVTPPPAAAPEALTPPALRLPDTVRPAAYALTMRMNPAEEKIEGKVSIELTLAEETNVVWIHAGENLTIRSAHLVGHGASLAARARRAAKDAAPSTSKAQRAEDLVALVFDGVASPGRYQLELVYDGTLPSRDGRGAYRQEERGDFYIFTQFESTDARRAFPCFDEPGFKTPYRITLEVPRDQLAFANTPQVGEGPAPGGWKTVMFAPSKPLPSYLVAFAVGPFEVVDAGEAGANKVPIRIIVPKGKANEAAYAAETTGQVLEELEKYFGIPYPYEKLDHIAVPMKGGAMENPGLITYGTGTILGKPEDKSLRLQRGYLSIAAHELGHIWFGDLVTTGWWDDIWLNEAFATWISAKIVDRMRPAWDGAVSRAQSKNGVMSTDALVSTRRIRQPIESHHDIANAFDGITYQKGAAVVGMFEAFVGEEAFRKGLHDYLRAHEHGNATAAEFLADVGASLKKQGEAVPAGRAEAFAPAFSTFLDQPGVPLVSAELSCAKGTTPKLVLAQQRYLPQGSAGSSEQTWKIPVCASYPGGTRCTVLVEPKGELPLEGAQTAAATGCPAWVNPNAGGAGYYRVRYGGDLFTRLLKNGGKTLTVADRVGILGDALALVRSGHMPEGEVLALVPGLVKEGNHHLVGMTVGLVSGLEGRYVPDELRPNYRRLVAKLYGARAKQLGWKPKAGEDDGTTLLRPGLVALVAREDEAGPLAKEARKLTEAWLTDKAAIDHDLTGTVLATAGRSADEALWEKLFAAAKATKERKERGLLLGAMAAARDPKLVARNFEVALSDAFDPRESMTLVWGGLNDPKNRQTTYDFVKANYDKLLARQPRQWGASLVGVGSAFCDAEHKADVESFFTERNARLPGGPRLLAQTLESITLCDAQRSQREAGVRAFLQKQ